MGRANMPGMNGLELLERIKAHPGLRDIPVDLEAGVRDRAVTIRAVEDEAGRGLQRVTCERDG